MSRFTFFLLTFIFLIAFAGNAQQKNHEDGVKIIEEVGNKKTLIFAKNENNESRSIFFKVNAEGYRRRADRPVIKQLPPNEKIHLITLIPLTDQKSNYTYTFVVNKELENIQVSGQKE